MSLFGSAQALALLAALNGLGQATGWSGLVRCVGNWFEPRERGVVMAWWSTNYAVGGFFATIFATYVATSANWFPMLGWRRSFLFPPLLLSLVLILFLRAVPKQSDRVDPEDVNGAGTLPSQSVWVGLKELIRQPLLWIISSSFFLLQVARYAFLFWLPL